jgi:DNA-binding NarL/FixJ family response regulator
VRVLVINAFPLVQEALRMAVVQARPHAAVVATSDLAAARALIERDPCFDAALVDLDAPSSPLSALAAFRLRFPAIQVVVTSTRLDATMAYGATQLGVVGCVSTAGELGEVVATLRASLAGEAAAPAEAAPAPIPATSVGTPIFTAPRHETAPVFVLPVARGGREPRLTDRQREVLALLAEGLPNKLISRRLDLSPSTVKAHISAILRALNARNRTEAVMRASYPLAA